MTNKSETKELKVTKVRYFETRRGIGYQCSTNINGIYIWNDGDGGGTYIDSILSEYSMKDFHNKYFPNISHGTMQYEKALENLIDEHENSQSP